MSSFLDLQNGFYNALSQGIGFPPGSPFQLIQPSTPLPDGTTDSDLWAYMNNIPPFSLTQNYIQSGGNKFFSDYQTLMSALLPTVKVDFKADIGPDVFADWVVYVRTLNPFPTASQLPQVFFNWAIVFHPDVANIGSSDLSVIVLEPISRAQTILSFYTTVPPTPPAWTQGYATLKNQLANAPSKQFTVTDVQSNSNVSKSWTQGSNSGFFGLWGSSSSSSTQSETYASKGVSLNASFSRILTFVPSPGPWYDSGAMGLAFSHKTGSPWNPKSPVNWENTFGSNGNMQRFAGSMIVVSGMSIAATSQATFSKADQQTITQNSGAGLWPFYNSGGSSGSSTSASFNESGAMTTVITSPVNVPLVIGVNVISAADYLGHAVEGAKRFAAVARAA
jgi:hypothetical protein